MVWCDLVFIIRFLRKGIKYFIEYFWNYGSSLEGIDRCAKSVSFGYPLKLDYSKQ